MRKTALKLAQQVAEAVGTTSKADWERAVDAIEAALDEASQRGPFLPPAQKSK